MSVCRLCRSPSTRLVIDFGTLVVTNQFVGSSDQPPFRQPISLSECLRCGVVQLTDVPPVEQLRPKFRWMTQREPEGRYAETAVTLVREARLMPRHRIFGLSESDAGILEQLKDFETTILDPYNDLGITLEHFGNESLQSQMTVERANKLLATYGPMDVIISRYLLEHAQNAAEFLEACKLLLVTAGVLVVGVPDCQRDFRNTDVTVVWEQHALYFTEQTLVQGLNAAGFDVIFVQRIADVFEDHLVAICRVSAKSRPTNADCKLIMDPAIHDFAGAWPQRRSAFQNWAKQIRAGHGRIAVFGAGHRACTLIDAAGISDLVDCVIDDSVEKQEFVFPVGELPIRSSNALVERGITHCLLTVNLDLEDRIVAKNAGFVSAGGQFVSCFANSTRSLRFS